MSDAFITTRNMLREQAASRSALASKLEASYPPVPVTSARGTYSGDATDLDAIARQASIAASGRTVLTMRYRISQALAAGLTPRATDSRPASLAWWHRNMPSLTREHLTYEGRALIRAIRSSDAKYALAVAGIAMPENPVAVEHQLPTSSRLPRGLVDGREVRVNTRGAYGKRGIRGSMSRVSQMDNRIPVWLLRKLDTVGVATHPDADSSDYDNLLRLIRAAPGEATLRLYMPGDTVGTVLPAHDYGKAVDETVAAHHASPTDAQAHLVMPDVVRYAATVGYLGNIV